MVYSLCTASGWTFTWLGLTRKMTVPFPVGDVKIVSLISTFVLNALTLKVLFFQGRSLYIFQGVVSSATTKMNNKSQEKSQKQVRFIST